MHNWIKLHVKLAEHEIMTDQTALTVFIYLLLTANSKGEGRVSRHSTSQILEMHPSTFRDAFTRLEKKYDLTTTEPTGRFTRYFLKNWSKYQTLDDRMNDNSTTIRRQFDDTINKNKNKNKSISNTNRQSQKEDKRNEKVSYLIQAYQTLTGYPPTDQKPRFEAWNLLRQIKKTYQDLGKEFTQESFEKHVKAYVSYLSKNDWASSMQLMRTFRLKYKLFKKDVIKCQT
jgi:hypothetical protein